MSYYPYEFEAQIEYHDVGSAKYAYRVVFVPDEVAAELPLERFPRLRISGEISDCPIEAALTPVRGRWYILLSKKLLGAISATIGDIVQVRFQIADQDFVEVPDVLTRALERDPAMKTLWDRATPGKKRGLAYRVASAKTDPTRQKRLEEVFGILRGEIDMRGKLIAK